MNFEVLSACGEGADCRDVRVALRIPQPDRELVKERNRPFSVAGFCLPLTDLEPGDNRTLLALIP